MRKRFIKKFEYVLSEPIKRFDYKIRLDPLFHFLENIYLSFVCNFGEAVLVEISFKYSLSFFSKSEEALAVWVVICSTILTIFPQIVLWVPSLMKGG